MVVNGSKSGKKPLLPFFFELWSNIKKRRKSTRYRAFSAVFIFLEHFLFLEWSTSLVRTRSPVRIRLAAPVSSSRRKTTRYCGFSLVLGVKNHNQGNTKYPQQTQQQTGFATFSEGVQGNFLTFASVGCWRLSDCLKRLKTAFFCPGSKQQQTTFACKRLKSGKISAL